MPEYCVCCGVELEAGEYVECADCADDNDASDFYEFLQERFDMETLEEYMERKENKW